MKGLHGLSPTEDWIAHSHELETRIEKLERMLDAADEVVEAHWNEGDVRAAIRRFEKVRAECANR